LLHICTQPYAHDEKPQPKLVLYCVHSALIYPYLGLGSTRTVSTGHLYKLRALGALGEGGKERRLQCQLGRSQQVPAMGRRVIHSFSSCFTTAAAARNSLAQSCHSWPGFFFSIFQTRSRATSTPVLNRQTRCVKHDDPCPASQVALRLSHFRHGGYLRPRGRRPSETWHEMPCGRILPNTRYNVRLCAAEQMLLCNM
jgi:hypothetical protein